MTALRAVRKLHGEVRCATIGGNEVLAAIATSLDRNHFRVETKLARPTNFRRTMAHNWMLVAN